MPTLPDAGDYTQAKVLVLGASGFIGRWVSRALSKRAGTLYLVVHNRKESDAIFSSYGVAGEVIETDLSNLPTVRDLLHDIRPDITFNLAGYGVDVSERDERAANCLNAELPGTVCDALADSHGSLWPGARLIHTGSALEYGDIAGDLSEHALPNPTTLYGRSKLAGTEALLRCVELTGMRAVTARLFTVYGPGEHPGRLLPALLQCARTGEVLPLTDGRQRRDFTFVEDVAEGLLRLGRAEVTHTPLVNLATGRLASVREFVETAARVLGISTEQLRFGALPTRPEEMRHDPVSLERLRQVMGWAPHTSIEEGIRRTSEWA
jgi:UDP-glucose 4-epimerase